MNLPNKITSFRILCVPLVLALASMEFRHHWILVYVLFSLACLTDYFDGKIARSRGIITDWGKLMDPLADKCLHFVALLILNNMYVIKTK